MWLCEGGVAMIVPLKQLKKLWQITYDLACHGGTFVVHTNKGNVVIKNNDKGKPYIDIKGA